MAPWTFTAHIIFKGKGETKQPCRQRTPVPQQSRDQYGIIRLRNLRMDTSSKYLLSLTEGQYGSVLPFSVVPTVLKRRASIVVPNVYS